ncbi:MAG: phosphatase PAP2 family protein, partial [Longimicrobiales bacterium]
PALYTELTVLNRAVWNGHYFDSAIIQLEALFFGGQLSRTLAEAAPFLWLSEPLHLAYLSYYLIIFGPPLLFYLQRRGDAFRATTFTLMLAFFAHYLVFVYFPVQGPRYLFAAPGGDLAAGMFYQAAHRVLEAGSAQGSAFPSSHVGVSLAQTLCVARYAPRLAWPLAGLTTGLAVGAVYGGFHYAIDALVGAALGALIVLCAPRLYRALHQRPV